MKTPSNQNQKLRIAIIGAGPAGFYTAGQLFKQKNLDVEVDMFERLPTPYGLVRGGVAPDHQKIKSVTKIYEKIGQQERFRFFGFVEFGTDIQLADLKRHYHQIVFATGAQLGRQLDIPGSDLLGSHPASDFVAWYNGHPDYRDLEFDLSQEHAVVIGNGNVAIDVVRILSHTPDELHKTDIADYALAALRNSQIKEIYLLGRRGPAQAAFTPPEIVELGKLKNLDIYVPPDEAKLDSLSQIDMEANPDRAALKNIATIQSFAKNQFNNQPRRITIRFLVSPVEICGDQNGKVRSMRLVKNTLSKNEVGTLRAVPTPNYEDIPAGLVFHSIGYRGSELSEIPFNSRWGIIPNQKGRVTSAAETHLPGIYTVGWIKRGPTGVIGTNKLDATETVATMLADIGNNAILNPELPTAAAALDMVQARQPQFVLFTDWLHLDQLEIERGAPENRPRVKFSIVAEMLDQIGN
jgi:ferredoxin/flavodoxin---NADP+ reductase